jgi:hypothetical protein
VIENLGRSESGAGAHQIDIGLFDIYRQASYTCDVTCMGNVMIQPTMYFYLKNVPMFRGSYWITEVSHNIRNNNIVTTFKGTRIPYASLPDPKDSFLSSYKVLFDKITRTAVAKTKEEENTTPATATEQPYTTTDGKTFLSDLGPSKSAIKGETLIKEQGVTAFGVPYNGYNGEKYIQKTKCKYTIIRFGGIYGKNGPDDGHEGTVPYSPLWSIVKTYYSRDQIAFLYGGDGCQDLTTTNHYAHHLLQQMQFGHCFVRELAKI